MRLILQKSSATFFVCLALETFKQEPDSYINEQQPMLEQLSILQLFEADLPFGDYQSLSYWSKPEGSPYT